MGEYPQPGVGTGVGESDGTMNRSLFKICTPFFLYNDSHTQGTNIGMLEKNTTKTTLSAVTDISNYCR